MFRKTISLSLIIVLLVAIPISTALAYTEGPNNPGLGTNVTGIGTEAWQNPENITEPGSPYTSVTLYQGHTFSNYLQGTQYGLSVPADASITGISLDIRCNANAHNPSILDNVVSLVKAGTIVGDNKSSPLTWPLSASTITYGGPTDLWGTSWTPEDINSPDFGAVLAVYRQNNGNNDRTATVDFMQISVYYTYNTSTTVDCGYGNPVVAYGDRLTCVVMVSRLAGDQTPSGSVNWTTDGSGLYDPNPCTLSGADGVATCSVTYTPSSVGSGTHLLTGTYAGDQYFAPSNASLAVSVFQRPITVTADTQTRFYGDADPEFTFQITSGSLVFSDTFTGTLTRDPGEVVGNYAILQGSLALSENYNLTYVGADLTITPRPITITADPQTKIFGQPDPQFTYQITEGTLVFSDTFTGTLTRAPGENLGNMPFFKAAWPYPAITI